MGLRERLAARSHECDFPADVLSLPQLTEAKFKVEGSSAEIDARVREIVRDGLSVYRVDGEALKALEPDVIVTQDHCEVCAVSLSDVEAATCTWTGQEGRHRLAAAGTPPPTSTPTSRALPARCGVPEAGERLVAEMRTRLEAVRGRVAGRARPRVAFIEWVEPLMAGGNWMPELIEAAGGRNLFGLAGKHSDWMRWEELVAADPEVIVVAPCGYGLARCLEELPLLEAKPGWADIAAVRTGRVYFADGNAYFNRPGPRLADSAEMLVEMIHPEVAEPVHKGTAWVAPVR